MAILSLEIPDEFVPSALTYIPLYLGCGGTTEEKTDCIKMALLKSLREMYTAGKVMDANIDLVQVRVDADVESAVMAIVE